MKNAFVVDFSGDSLSAGFVSEDLAVSALSKFDLANFMAGDQPPLEKMLSLLQAKMRTSPTPIDLVSLGFDCDLSADRRGIANFPGASWLNGEPLADTLEQILGVPVFMERRAKMFLYYDRAILDLPDDALTVGCYVNDDYECVIRFRGDFVSGRSGAAGNIGHLPVFGREDICRCGRTGCTELYGTGYRLKQLHSLIFPDIAFEDIFSQHAEHPLLQDFLYMMSYPLSVAANVLDPDYFVLGGAIPTMPNFPFGQLEDFLREACSHPFPGDSVVLLPSTIKEADCLLCLAYYCFQTARTPGG